MSPKIFITGATGYIGGDALYALYNKHPEYTYSALVRSEEKGKAVQAAFPNVRIVVGTLDDAEILEREAADADVVIHTADASDHEGAARAIAKGLSSGHTASRPGYWLHTGGTGILCWYDERSDDRLGTWNDSPPYNDWSGVSDLTSLPDDAFHRNVDKIVLEAGTREAEKVRTAILCPPTIYGKGRGPSNARSRQAYELAKYILETGVVPIIGPGKSRWDHVHVADLSEVFVKLTEEAVKGSKDEELWGEKGYFLVESGDHVWSELARKMGRKAVELGYLKEVKEQSLGKEEAFKQAGFQAVSWGLNSRGRAERAKKTLGWKPAGSSLDEEIETIVKEEKERLG
ncbi:NAD(P)-binding protein [Aaosphaeria arxii CBS 175.79]|uniref:NAD(P)-binding protein n=1 Tax=Aaosphaeria arxii CBS 175.79 TaxID=1450172 RepID=A0A6A5XZW9_9PLEO|nr:NAD(P)-binding protein [Aaosphaeria arxii CBS 175.79]KAF2018815.1 NAD(P)-binding protein [Aaosphaeria arxii CBS 175.79]